MSCFGMPGERHQGRRDPDPPERLVARAREAPGPRGLAGDVVHHPLHEALRVLGRVNDRVVGGAAGARRVDVQVHRAPPVELQPRVIRVPRGAGVAPVGVPRPEGEAEPSPERAPPRRQEPRDLEHRRVRGPVVHGAEVPAVHVPGEEDEAVLGGPVEVRRQVRDRRPARAHPGHEANAATALLDQLPNALAVGPADRQARGARDAPGGVGLGRPPDRGHDHVVEVVAVDEDLPDRPRLLRGPRLARCRQAVQEGDLAGRARAREVRRGPVPDVDHLGVEPVGRGRERVSEPLDHRAVRKDHAALQRQADEGLDLAALDGVAVALERPLDVVVGLRLARSPGLPLPRGDRARVRHQGLRRHGRQQVRLVGIPVVPVRGQTFDFYTIVVTSLRRCLEVKV